MKYNYSKITRIDDNSPLGDVFNEIIGSLNRLRIMVAPRTFDGFEPSHAMVFYESCLWEMWMKGTIDRLRQWQDRIGEYLGEFEGSWRYYACSKRLEFIRTYGEEDEDCDESGEIVADDSLSSFTIVSDLFYDDAVDIIQDTTPADLKGLADALKRQGTIAVDFIRFANITAYKVEENGDGEFSMIPVTKEDIEMKKAIDGVRADDLAASVLRICTSVNELCSKIRDLNCFHDNRKELSDIRKKVDDILHMRL